MKNLRNSLILFFLIIATVALFISSIITKFNTFRFYAGVISFISVTSYLGIFVRYWIKKLRKRRRVSIPSSEPGRYRRFLDPDSEFDQDTDREAPLKPIQLSRKPRYESASTFPLSEVSQQSALTTSETLTQEQTDKSICPTLLSLPQREYSLKSDKVLESTLSSLSPGSYIKYINMLDRPETSNQSTQYDLQDIKQPETSRRAASKFVTDSTMDTGENTEDTTEAESRFNPHFEVIHCDPMPRKCSLDENGGGKTLRPPPEAYSSFVKKHANTMYHKSKFNLSYDKSKINQQKLPGCPSSTESSRNLEASTVGAVELNLEHSSEIKVPADENIAAEIDTHSSSSAFPRDSTETSEKNKNTGSAKQLFMSDKVESTSEQTSMSKRREIPSTSGDSQKGEAARDPIASPEDDIANPPLESQKDGTASTSKESSAGAIKKSKILKQFQNLKKKSKKSKRNPEAAV